MNKDNLIVKTIKTDKGRAALINMIFFLLLTFIISFFFSGTTFGFFGGMICSIISIASGQGFCKEMIYIRDEANNKAKK